MVPGANSEPSPSHAFLSLGDTGGASGAGGVAIASTMAVTGTIPVVKKVQSSQLLWYTVIVSYDVGIFQGWDQVAPLVLGVPGAVFQRHSSLASAHAHYSNAMSQDDVEVVPRPSNDDYNSYDDNDE
ncbi:hypothetical protein EDD18DRAFT_1103727 [Armillaria luteobubalina]|uniref:Ribonuclease H1 N-terminal domain-containing protein n=1 Tax=Armillaria luteobubalina TaxID=153913 RepID=A0AA39UYC7_9AGAR|nr:hypothetical protein EDD18DRAFT_1103727 [Armillaria luteobubalina]